MQMKKDVIGEVTVEVKAGLSVDKQTFRVCLSLVQIYAKNNGLKGMVMRFDEDSESPVVKPLMTENEVDDVMYGGCK